MRITIIGGGIIGLATALRLTQKLPRASVTVLEKEAGVGTTPERAQQRRAALRPVLQAGLAEGQARGYRNPPDDRVLPGARHTARGLRKAGGRGRTDEIPRLNDLFERGQQNGLSGLRKLGASEMREIEPHAGGVAAIHVPEEGIVDYPAVCKTLVRCLAAAGGKVVTDAAVTGLRRTGTQWIAETACGRF